MLGRILLVLLAISATTQAQTRVRGSITIDRSTVTRLCSALPNLGKDLMNMKVLLPQNIQTWDDKARTIGTSFGQTINRLTNVKSGWPQIGNAFNQCIQGTRGLKSLGAVPQVIEDLTSGPPDLSASIAGCADHVRRQAALQSVGSCLGSAGVFDIQGIQASEANARQLADNLGAGFGNALGQLFSQSEGGLSQCFNNALNTSSNTQGNASAFSQQSVLKFQQCLLAGAFNLDALDGVFPALEELNLMLNEPATPARLSNAILSCGSQTVNSVINVLFPIQELGAIANELRQSFVDLKAAGDRFNAAVAASKRQGIVPGDSAGGARVSRFCRRYRR